jgi:sigma-B regulation protein RsbU (phosphoserine phosphatase)
VQQALFPRVLPDVPGLDYAGVCRPAQGVSGDYYDFLALGDGKLGLLLADVSGKGMSAALLGASLHAGVRANAAAAGVGCGEVIAKASHLLYETSEANRFATVFYGVYDPATRLLTYANAGHNPPMLVRDGACIRLKSLTPPAGMLPDLPARQDRIELASGDWLLIFSDGIPEAADDSGEEFGDNGLLEAFGWHGKGTAAEACEGVIHAVRNHFREQRQPDDITLIAMKVL